MKKRNPALILWVALLFLWGSTVLLQQRIDLRRGAFQKIESFYYLPSGDYLRMVSLEFKEATADLLWFRALQFVSGKDPSGRGYDWFYQVMDRATDLDPKFAYAYQVGGITLSVLSDHVDLSNALLEKGVRNNPDDWQIPFNLGFNYMYHLKDNLKAAQYMERAARIQGSPKYLPTLAARLYHKVGEKQTALIFLEGIYRSTQDEKMKERIAQRIEEIMKGGEGAPLNADQGELKNESGH